MDCIWLLGQDLDTPGLEHWLGLCLYLVNILLNGRRTRSNKTLTVSVGFLSRNVSHAFESMLNVYKPFADDNLGKGVHLYSLSLSVFLLLFHGLSLLFK